MIVGRRVYAGTEEAVDHPVGTDGNLVGSR